MDNLINPPRDQRTIILLAMIPIIIVGIWCARLIRGRQEAIYIQQQNEAFIREFVEKTNQKYSQKAAAEGADTPTTKQGPKSP